MAAGFTNLAFFAIMKPQRPADAGATKEYDTMKHHFLRAFGIFLFALVCAGVITACGGTSPNAPVTTAPETTAPITTEPVTTAPETTAPITTEPVTAAPETTAPVTTEPVTTAPETTAPVTTEPVTTAPETTAHVHRFGEWAVTTPATCTASGIQTRTCACGAHETMPLDPISHTAVTDAAVAPTCTAPGLTAGSHCSVCGTILTAQAPVPAAGHRFGAWAVTTPATCTASGTQTRTCACGARETKPLDPIDHTAVTDAAVAPSCTAPGLTAGSHCSACGMVLTAQAQVPPTGHTETVLIAGFAPSCATAGVTDKRGCSSCGTVLSEQEKLPAAGHTFTGGKCTVCGEAEPDYTNPDRYANDYGYRYLGTQKNGAELQRLYRDIDARMKAVHDDRSVDFEPQQFGSRTRYIVFTFDLAAYGIDENQIELIKWLYYYDHPLYYWFDTLFCSAIQGDSRSYSVTAFEEFADGDKRADSNRNIYNGVKEYTALTAGETSAYEIALAYHDTLAYNSTKAGLWSERVSTVINTFEKKPIDCSGYAKAFHLLLNFSGVESIYIRGRYGGETGMNHVWNLVQMDDGQWYWFDVTFDDYNNGSGFGHKYFCVPQSKFSQKNIYGDYVYGEGFLNLYALPERAAAPFRGDAVLEIDETFTADGCTYALSGYGTVRCIASAPGRQPPATGIVSHDGRVYEIKP